MLHSLTYFNLSVGATSVLNDSICVTLFRIATGFIGSDVTESERALVAAASLEFVKVFVGSMLIGLSCGLLSALALKHGGVGFFDGHRVLLVTLFISTMYAPFFLSELLGLSGIVTMLFSGMTARRYASRNVDYLSRRVISFVFQLMAHLSETCVFLSLGINIFSYNGDANIFTGRSSLEWQSLGALVLLSNATRALTTTLIISLFNCFRLPCYCTATDDEYKTASIIPPSTMFILWFGTYSSFHRQARPHPFLTNSNSHIHSSLTLTPSPQLDSGVQ